jgi:hypothetical protein
MGTYSEYYLNSRSNVVQLELVEVTHPNFTQAFRIVRNARDGITVDLSPTELGVPFMYYPAQVEQLGARDDLDSAIRMDLGDLGEVIPDEIDAVMEAGGFMTKPAVRYFTFQSDQLTQPLFGPVHLEVPSISFNEQGASFEARAPSLNSTKTGERLTLDRIPMQRGFL